MTVEVSWFSTLGDDNYESVNSPDPALLSSGAGAARVGDPDQVADLAPSEFSAGD